MTDISPAINLLLDYNESFAYKDMSEIRAWLNDGCDLKKDIVPAMQQAMARNKGITAVAYFRPMVQALKQARIDTDTAKAQRKAPVVLDDALKAKNLSWLRRMDILSRNRDDAWLAEYEKQHGEVMA